MTHIFFTVVSVVTQITSWGVFIESARQLYIDRDNLHQLVYPPRSFKTMRVFRVCGFVGVLPLALSCIDFYGAFHIYTPYARTTLFAIAVFPLCLAFCVAICREFDVGISFLGIDHEKWNRCSRILFSVTFTIFSVFYCTAMYVSNRTFFNIVRAVLCWTVFVVSITVVSVYVMLERHYRWMQRNDNGLKDHGGERWTEIVKMWRTYSLVVSAIGTVQILSVIFDAVSVAGREATRNNINFEYNDYETMPRFNVAAQPLIMIVTYGIIVWRAHSHQNTEESRKSKALQSPAAANNTTSSPRVSRLSRASRNYAGGGSGGESVQLAGIENEVADHCVVEVCETEIQSVLQTPTPKPSTEGTAGIKV